MVNRTSVGCRLRALGPMKIASLIHRNAAMASHPPMQAANMPGVRNLRRCDGASLARAVILLPSPGMQSGIVDGPFEARTPKAICPAIPTVGCRDPAVGPTLGPGGCAFLDRNTHAY